MLLVGPLKSGKSTIFSWLIGRDQQQLVYPDTGVELSTGTLAAGPYNRLVDAPGVTSLQDRSEDAHVIRDLLVRRRVGGVLLVLDAKNLRRGLVLAYQLAELETPVVVALNMIDEAVQRGLRLDAEQLSRRLGVPVIPTAAVEARGLATLRRALSAAKPLQLKLAMPEPIAKAADQLQALMADHPFSARGLAYQLLADIPQAPEVLDDHVDAELGQRIRADLRAVRASSTLQLDIALTEAELAQAEEQVRQMVQTEPRPRARLTERLAVWARRPATGIPIAIGVLALVYTFVGWLGATVLVDLLDGRLFQGWLVPTIHGWLDHLGPDLVWLKELLIGDFGLITVGLVLPVGIVIPVLATFFFAFAVLEDSGYLPRMSLLLDRALRHVGLNGKGLVPLVMGFSCVTMAVLTTRMLDTRKQRLIATLLLVLAAPCAPLISVMLVVLAQLDFTATVVLFGLIFLQFVLVGSLANWLLPGRKQDFLLELPPLRLPRLRTSLAKTGHRLYWFLREAIPYFVIGTLALYTLDLIGVLDGLREAARPVLERFVGLPADTADVFLMSFVRREAGAALMLERTLAGAYDGVQVVVTLLVMTLMVPCVNTLLVMFKERGLAAGSAVLAFVMAYALAFGALVNAALRAMEVTF